MAIKGSVQEIVFSRFKFSDCSSMIEVVPRSSCSENSRDVKRFLREDESVYLSQFLSQSSWQCLASFWWEKIKAVNKGRVSINKLQEKIEKGERQRERKIVGWLLVPVFKLVHINRVLKVLFTFGGRVLQALRACHWATAVRG